jgi:two-component system, sensor histidine kinase RegB
MHALPLPFIATVHLGTSAWLLRLRWFAVFGQLVTVFIAGRFGGELPWVPLLALIAVTAVSNAAYALWLQRARPRAVAGDRVAQADKIATSLMMLDLVTLTLMLYFSGGIDNPFSLFYFVNLAVGGVILRPRWAWVLTAMAILGCSLLIYASLPVPGLIEPNRRPDSSLHTLGLFIAYATCGSVVTHFVTRTAAELTRSERLLSETQSEHQRIIRLEGLTTLAAGAAHELATPLSTIDVIARELGRHLQDCETPQSVREDVRLIDQQLEICRQILRRMRVAVGDSMADSWDRTTVGDLIDCALEGVRDPDRVDVNDGPEAVERHPLWIPQEAVAQAIRNLIHNGLDASGRGGRVTLQATVHNENVQFRIRDYGRGMSNEELGRAGEPFYTTKEPGRGMGLGLFLTRNVVSRLGGSLDFESIPGRGTEAIVTLPCTTGDGSIATEGSSRAEKVREAQANRTSALR